MNGFLYLYFFLILLLVYVVAVGLIYTIYGLIKKDKWNVYTKRGLVYLGLPLAIGYGFFSYNYLFEKFTKKPLEKDLVGIYHVSRVNQKRVKSEYKNYILEFRNDGSFYLSPIQNINVCEKGTYSVDWQFDYNELSFLCKDGYHTAHIARGFTGFTIEFSIGFSEQECIEFTKE